MLHALRSVVRAFTGASAHFLRRTPRRLELCETLSFGNRGFVAVIRYEDQAFLIGGTNSSVALLAELGNPHGQGKDMRVENS